MDSKIVIIKVTQRTIPKSIYIRILIFGFYYLADQIWNVPNYKRLREVIKLLFILLFILENF